MNHTVKFLLPILLLLFSSPYAHAESGRDMPAVKDLLKSGKIAEASTLLQMEITEHPDNAEAHHLLGRLYLLEGDEVKAAESFNRAVSIDESYRGESVSEYYGAGLILLKDPRRSNIGLHYLNKYLLERKDKGMEIAPLLYKEGLTMIEANKFMSHMMLARAKELNPAYEKDEEFYFAYTLRSAHKPADLIKGGREFMSKFPQGNRVAEVLYLMGEANIELRRPQEARDLFKRLAKEFPDTEWGRKAAMKLK